MISSVLTFSRLIERAQSSESQCINWHLEVDNETGDPRGTQETGTGHCCCQLGCWIYHRAQISLGRKIGWLAPKNKKKMKAKRAINSMDRHDTSGTTWGDLPYGFLGENLIELPGERNHHQRYKGGIKLVSVFGDHLPWFLFPQTTLLFVFTCPLSVLFFYYFILRSFDILMRPRWLCVLATHNNRANGVMAIIRYK